MKKRVICGGEILYDFIATSRGTGLAGAAEFVKKPGGSPFNIAIGLSRLGIDVSFLVKIGDDEFGTALRNFLISEGVDMSYVVNGAGHNTTLAMAAVDVLGKPEYRFYRDNSADISLAVDELPPISPRDASAYTFGSLSLADNPAGETYMLVFEKMRSSGVMTMLDPNVRPLYVADRPIFKKRVKYLAPLVDILKLSDDDLYWLTGTKLIDEGLARMDCNPAGLVIVTEGAKGARAYWRGDTISVPCRPVEVAETSGCGDSFIAGVMSKLAPLGRSGLFEMTPAFLKNTLVWANACASIVASRYGAANSMPRAAEVEDFLLNGKVGTAIG
ncbi:MAG: carbohydrate kinase [Synergistaceae bacterium]|jgi:fructokinase|nr:carbohydrate kinase [Synergistaceae bacterium]